MPTYEANCGRSVEDGHQCSCTACKAEQQNQGQSDGQEVIVPSQDGIAIGDEDHEN